MLHGTDWFAGGFQITGNVTCEDGKFVYRVRFTWNDTIDPNYGYFLDNVANFFPGSTDYQVHFSWDETITLR